MRDKLLRSSGFDEIYLHKGKIRVISPYVDKYRPGWEEWPKLGSDGNIEWKHPQRIPAGVQRETRIAFDMIGKVAIKLPSDEDDIFEGIL